MKVSGPKDEHGNRSSLTIGNRTLNCANCNQQQPGANSLLKQQRGCRRYGSVYESESRWRIDSTGIEEIDHIDWCPASVYEPVYAGWVYEALKIKNLHGGLVGTTQQKLNHLVSRVVSFYDNCALADIRFDAQVADTERLLFEA